MGKIDTNYLYMVLDLENKELPLFVGTIQEVARYEGKKTNTISSAVSHAIERGSVSRYARVEIGEDDEL